MEHDLSYKYSQDEEKPSSKRLAFNKYTNKKKEKYNKRKQVEQYYEVKGSYFQCRLEIEKKRW